MTTTYNKDYLATHQLQISAQQTAVQGSRFVQALALPTGSRILDVGCGTGRHSFYLAQKGYVMTGVDISEDLLAVARQRSLRESGSVTFKHGDMRNLPFDKGAFDGALIAYSSWGYFSDAENLEVLRDIGRVLKPGGVLVLDWGSENGIKNYLENGTWDEQEKTWKLETDDSLPDGSVVRRYTQLNLTTLRFKWQYDHIANGKVTATSSGEQTVYTLLSLAQVLATAGFKLEKVWDNHVDDQPPTRCILRAVRQ